MDVQSARPGARIAVWLALAAVLACWFLVRHFDGLPAPLGSDAPATVFSAARADAVLARILGPENPHPTGSAENAEVRVRILREFADLGITARVDHGFACNGSTAGTYVSCATVDNIIAEVLPGVGKAIVLLAHYDSVAAGAGAADDGAGVAAILETARALKASSPALRHPILAVITDGEELGLLGARHFLNDPDLKARAGLVLNVEARGNSGPSLLFQTSSGNAKLIDLYADSVESHATSSLFPAIYEFIPNDTDLTLFLELGIPGVNFACIGNLAHYHTPLDRRVNLSAATLQHHGNNLLGMTRALGALDFTDLGREDAVFVSILGRWLPRFDVAWVLPLAAAVLVGLVIAGVLWRHDEARQWRVFLVPPAFILLALGFGEAARYAAGWIAQTTDPRFAHPAPLRLALFLGVALAALICARWGTARQVALSVWGWMAVWALVAGVLLPGAAPYFLFPAIVGAIAMIACGRASERIRHVLLALAAAAGLLVWCPMVVQGEALTGLAFQPLFTGPAAMAGLGLLPFLTPAAGDRAFRKKVLAALTAALSALVVISGLPESYSAAAPQRLNLTYVDDHAAAQGRWLVDTTGALPEGFLALGVSRAPVWRSPLKAAPSYVGPAGGVRFSPPKVSVAQEMEADGWRVGLRFGSDLAGSARFVVVPKDTGLRRVTIGGMTFETPSAVAQPTRIFCSGLDCTAVALELVFDGPRRRTVTIGVQGSGLPSDGAALQAARPATAVPYAGGDTTLILDQVELLPEARARAP